MTKLAYSFRTPKTEHRKHSRRHRVKGSSAGSGPVATASSSRRRSKTEHGSSGGDGDHSGSFQAYPHVSHTRDELIASTNMMSSILSKEEEEQMSSNIITKSQRNDDVKC
jgi:hypothetical protein